MNFLYWAAMAGIFAYFAYLRGWILTDFESISAKQAYILLEKDKNVTLLDVRTRDEFNRGHIRGTEHIPVGILSENLSRLEKDKKIMIYCRSGSRSVTASRLLIKHGFSPINVKGGFIAWKEVVLDSESHTLGAIKTTP